MLIRIFTVYLLILVSNFNTFSIPVRETIKRDTAYANTLYLKAQKFENNACYDSAIYYYQLSAKIFNHRKNPEQFLKCKNRIINVKRSAGRLSGLIEESLKILTLSLKKAGETADVTADSYNILGNLYSDQKNQDSALYYFRKASSIWTNNPDGDITKLANVLRNISVVYTNKGQFDSARYYINKNIALLKERFGEDHRELAGSYNSSGTIAYHLGKYDECQYYFGKVVRIREQSLGFLHPLTAEAYNNLAVMFMAKANYDTALVLNMKAYRIRVSKLDEKHPNIALSLNNIGNVYMAKGEYEKALDFHQQALKKRLDIFSSEHADVAMSYANIGVLYREMGLYQKALEYFLKYREILLRLFGHDNPYTADAYNNVGAAYADLGDYDKSLENLQTALLLRKKRGENAPGVSTSYNNIGSIYKFKGDYELALSFYRKSIDVIRNVNGNHHPDIARRYSNMGEIYIERGLFDTALCYFNRALELDTAFLGKTSAQVIGDYLNRGRAYGELNEKEKEFNDYHKGLNLSLQAFGEKHPKTAGFYMAIGNNLLNRHEKDSAKFFIRKSLKIKKAIYPSVHPELASAYRETGEFYERIGLNDSARIFFHESLKANYMMPILTDSIDPALVQNEPEFASTLIDLCRLNYHDYITNGNYYHLTQIPEYFKLIKSIINNVISDFTIEETKIKLLNKFSKNTFYAVDAAYKLFILTGIPDYNLMSFEFSEYNKASLLQDRVYGPGSMEDYYIPEKLIIKKKNLMGFIEYLQMKFHHSETGKDQEVKEKTLHTLDSLMICLKSVNDSINRYGSNFNNYDINPGKQLYCKIRTKLGENDALISYFLADSAIFTYVITKDTISTHRQALIQPDMTGRMVSDYLSALKKYEKEKIPELNNQLSNLLINNIHKDIAGRWKLIIIPDKILLYLPFETLCNNIRRITEFGDFRYQDYMIKAHDITYHYSAGLWCINDEVHYDKRENRLLAFAPVFSDNLKYANEYEPGQSVFSGPEDYEMFKSVSGERSQYRELPFTISEIDSIKILCDNYGIEVKEFTFRNATEKNLRANIGNSRYIHIATHGIVDNQHPEYSGLVFASDKNVDSDASINGFYNDAVLYAKEIYALELNSDLVVLSACKTGLGKLEEGEGIIGLVRGFLSAGAGNVLFSFWDVGDKNTLTFMSNFYRHLLSGENSSVALRKAKLELIARPDTSFPLIWGSFALIGNYREANK